MLFCIDEEGKAESQALQELRGYWLSHVTRNRDTIEEMPPEHQDEKDFYSKYCDEEGKLSITATTYLMRFVMYLFIATKVASSSHSVYYIQ